MTDPNSMVFRILSPRTVFAVTGGFGIYLGMALRNPVLLYAGVVSLIALFLCFAQAMTLLRSYRVRRLHTLRAFEGQYVPVTLQVENDGSVPQSLVLVEDQFPPGDTWRIRHLLEQPLRRHERAEINYTGECNHRRGLYTLGPVKIEGFDGLGFFRRVLLVEEVSYLLVYPSAVDLRMIELLANGTLAHVGTETTHRAGESTECLGTRPYRMGDNPSAIHWPSTARQRELIVKEFEELMTTEVTLMVDLGRMGLTGLGDQTSIEYAIKAAASIARRTVARSHSVQLYAIGRETTYIPTGRGERHLLLLLDRLALLKSEGEADFLTEVEHYLPLLTPGGTVFLIVSAAAFRLEAAPAVIHAMRRRKLTPVFVLIDDRAFIKLYREQEDRHLEAKGLEEIARELVLLGARVHLVTKAKSPAQALLQGLDTPGHGTNARH